MGELSKSIGEEGERLVLQFLKKLGWYNLEEGIDISCIHAIRHRREGTEQRKTHGIDLLFRMKSNLQDFLGENIIVSVKFSGQRYKSSPQNIFKGFLIDLAWAVECFSRTEKANEIGQIFPNEIKSVNNIGVLFWMNTDRSSSQDIISMISNIEMPDGLNFGRIHVLDNAKVSFLFDSITKVEGLSERRFYFNYNTNSQNFKDPAVKKYGAICPVEYLSAPVLSFRIMSIDGNTDSICLSCRDSYSTDNFLRLMNLARDFSSELITKYILIFDGYDDIRDRQSVNSAKQSLGEDAARLSIHVYGLNGGFRSMLDAG